MDLSRIDENIQAIRGVTSSWDLPDLPHSTVLDLATREDQDPQTLTETLGGLGGDMTTALQPTPLALPNPVDPPFQLPSVQQLHTMWNGVAGLRPPTMYATDGTETFKREAVKLGYLADTTDVTDPRWYPELNQVRRTMMLDEFNRRLSGDRPGATTVAKVSDFIGNWLSPTGLLSAAVNLDFLPDPKNIARETAGWLGKIRKAVAHPTPHNILDTLGPIDDIIVPVVNTGLLFAGVGEIFNFARVATAAEKGLDAAQAVRGLYRLAGAAKFLRPLAPALEAADYGADAARLAEPSFLGRHLSNFGPTQALGNRMSAWRELRQVQMSKKVIQQGMRLGLASRAEGLLPGQDGYSIGDVGGSGQTIEEWRKRAMTNPLSWGFEAFFTPTTIFEPGTIGAVTGRVASAAKTGLLGAVDEAGATTSRGALMYLPVKKWRFAPVTENQGLTMEFHRGVRTFLEDNGHSDVLRQFDETTKAHSGGQAIADIYTGGDKEKLGRLMAWVSMAAAVDHNAASTADEWAGRIRHTDGWLNAYHLIRNKDIAQLREFDPGDIDGIIYKLATEEGVEFKSKKRVVDTVKKWRREIAADPATADLVDRLSNGQTSLMSDLDPTHPIAKLQATAVAHNENRIGHLKSLFDNHLKPGVIEAYLPQVLPTFARWDDWVDAMDQINGAYRDGLLNESLYATAHSPANRRISMFPTEKSRLRKDPLPFHMAEMFEDPGYTHWVTHSVFAPLAKAIDPGVGKFVAMRIGTSTKQDYLNFAAEVGRTLRVDKALKKLAADGHGSEIFSELSRLANNWRAEQQDLAGAAHEAGDAFSWQHAPIDDWLSGLGQGRKIQKVLADGSTHVVSDTALIHGGPATERIKSVLRYMMENDLSFRELRPHVDAELARYDEHPAWAEKFGIDSQFDVKTKNEGDSVTVSTRPMDLQAKVNALYRKSKWVAAEVDAPPHIRDGLGRLGYKLVHGVEYLMPADLLEVQPFADFSQESLRTASIGNYFERQDPQVLAATVKRSVRGHVQEQLKGLTFAQRSKLNVDDIHSQDLDTIIDSLHGILKDRQVRAQVLLDDAEKGTVYSRTSARLHTGNTPRNILDLGLNSHSKFLMGELQRIGYTEETAQAVWTALKQARRLGFKTSGLVDIENHLRSSPILLNSLGLLGKTDARDMISARGAAGLVAKGAAAVAPAYLADAITNRDGVHINPLDDKFSLGDVAQVAASAALGKVGQHTVLPKVLNNLQRNTRWMRYAYLADDLVELRDRMRFTLSPIFDASRYTEGLIRAQLVDLPPEAKEAGALLRFNQSPSAFKKLHGPEEWDRTVHAFQNAARGEAEYDTLEETSRWFTQVGILGYNPNDWMVSTFGNLRSIKNAQGVPVMTARKAYETVRDAYTYGVTGRSAAEQSVNFVFFPFSFQKQVMGHLAKHLSHDLSRAVMIHDAVKAYDVADQNFNLHERWRAYLPLAAEIRRFNLFAYGISPGSLGGINRPYLDFFLPVGAHIAGKDGALHVQKLAQRMLPVVNDWNTMVDHLGDQGHVLISPAHVAHNEEVKRGWEQWIHTRDDIERMLKDTGYSMGQVSTNPRLAPVKDYMAKQKAEIAKHYPGWWESRNDAIDNRQRTDAEIHIRVAEPRVEADQAVVRFVEAEKELKKAMSDSGLSFSDPEDMPPQAASIMRNLAVTLAQQYGGFGDLYRRLFQSTYGPIEKEAA